MLQLSKIFLEGVVRYRDPYENVDIDVERAPNASTNASNARKW